MVINLKSKVKTVALFDVGTSSIGLSLVNLTKDKPEIVFSKRMLTVSGTGSVVDHKTIIKTVHKLIEENLQAFPFSPKEIYFFLSSRFLLNQTRVVYLKKPTNFLVTQQMVDSLIKEEISKFEEERVGLSNKILDSKNVIIDQKIMQVKLNGYEVSNFIGKSVKSLEISIYISIGSKKILKDLQDISEKYFHNEFPLVHSFIFSAFSTLRDILVNVDKFVLIDIGRTATEITVTRDNIITESSSFPGGINDILSAVASEFSVSTTQASSYISMFLKGKLSGGASSGSAGKLQKKLDDILKKSLVVWKSGLVTSFKKLTSDFLLPQTFFIISHNQLGALYEDAFNDPDLSRFMRLGKPAFVSSLSGKYLSNFCVNKSTVPTDAPLSLEAIFVDKLR